MPGLPVGPPMGLLGFPAKANIVSAEKCHACTASDISYIRPLGRAGCVSYIWQPYVKGQFLAVLWHMLHLTFDEMEAVTKDHSYHSHIIRIASKPNSVKHKHRYTLSKVTLLPFPTNFLSMHRTLSLWKYPLVTLQDLIMSHILIPPFPSQWQWLQHMPEKKPTYSVADFQKPKLDTRNMLKKPKTKHETVSLL